MGKFQDVIAFAVSNEVQAHDFYQSVAEKTNDPVLKSIFQGLANEENRHKDFLEGLFSQNLVTIFFGEVADYHLAEMVDKPILSMEMKPLDAIALAMKKEQEAMGLYQKLARQTSDGAKKTMFIELSKMEQQHKATLEDIYTNMAYVEEW